MKRFLSIVVLAACAAGSFMPGIAVPKAEAIFGLGDIVYDPVNYAVNGLKLSAQYLANFSMGMPGSGASARAAVKASRTPCDTARASYDLLQSADALGGMEAIAGNSTKIAALSTKLATLNTMRICYESVKAGLDSGGSLASVAGGQQVLSQLQEDGISISEALSSIGKRIDDVTKQRNDAVNDLYKAMAIRILNNVQQKITTKLVNQMVAKYKISDFQRYADAVATQIYTTNYISDHYATGTDQMILKSLLQNDGTQSVVLPLIREKVNSDVGFVPDRLDTSSQNFYTQMSRTSANPYLTQAVYQDKLDTAQGSAKSSAQQEVSQGNGFIPVRNISAAVVQEQQSLDKQRQALQKELETKQKALVLLQNQESSKPGSVDSSQITRARDEVAATKAKMDTLATQPSFKPIAQGITNPAGAVSNFLSGYLQSHLNNANTPKTENLPFFASFVESVANNFLTNIIEQGSTNLNFLEEAGFKAGNIAANLVISQDAESAALKAAEASNVSKSVVFVGAKDGSAAGQYALSWDASLVSGAARIAITGTGFQFGSTSLKNKIVVKAPANTVLTLTVYNAATGGTALSTATFTVPLQQNPTLNLPGESGTSCATADQSATLTCINGQLQDNGVIPPPPTMQVGSSTEILIPLSLGNASPQVAGASTTRGPLITAGSIPVVSRENIRGK